MSWEISISWERYNLCPTEQEEICTETRKNMILALWRKPGSSGTENGPIDKIEG